MDEQTVRRRVRVRPGASRTKVGGSWDDGQGSPALVVAVQAPAVDGRANVALLAALAKAVGTPRAAITVVSGHTSRTKLVELPSACCEAWDALLES